MAQGTQISSTEKSTAMLRPWYTRSHGRMPYISAATLTKLADAAVVHGNAGAVAVRAGR